MNGIDRKVFQLPSEVRLEKKNPDTFLILMCFFAGQQYGEEFGKVSMMRKVPVMKDGDFVLTER